ncbi:hypothetical protein [Thermococcus sp.]|uniref:hypothetical protein n=1 Tax=Thermococcus sp. TaxID=35749 RepID=UPI002619E08E|nr:hypothetical protein [Thermococcus sp.]
MKNTLKGCLYSAILSAGFFAYFVEVIRVETSYALGLAVASFAIFLGVWSAKDWKESKKKKAVILIGLIALLSIAIAPISPSLAVNTFVTFTVGALALIYREELLPSMPAFMYAWLGAVVGFVLAVVVFPHTHMGDVARALGLIGLILVFAVLFLLVGKKVHYRPFNRYPV